MTGYTTVTTISTYYVLFVPVSMHLALKPSWQVQHVVLYIVQSLVLNDYSLISESALSLVGGRNSETVWRIVVLTKYFQVIGYTQVRRFSLFNPREVLFVSFFVRVLRQVIFTDESVCFPCAQASWDLEWRTSAAVWATEFLLQVRLPCYHDYDIWNIHSKLHDPRGSIISWEGSTIHWKLHWIDMMDSHQIWARL